MSKVRVFTDNTKLRLGGSRQGPNNLITKFNHGDYEAFYQCTGEEVTEGDTNRWWVKIVLDTGEEGWVSGVCIKDGGGKNAPVKDIDGDVVEQRPTEFV